MSGKAPKRKGDGYERELAKYFNNVYNATLITFANSFSSICESMNVDYSRVKEVAVQRNHIQDIYLNSSEHTKGFGGACLPKDPSALNELAKKVKNQSDKYRSQLKNCQRKLNRNKYIIF